MTIKVLLIGSGAREQAIAEALLRTKQAMQLFCLATHVNPGIAPHCQQYHLGDINDRNLAVELAREWQIDFAIIGPEAPLAAGVVDALLTIHIPSVGPQQQVAQIETSKRFTRQLMAKYKIPGQPRFQCFNDLSGVNTFLDSLADQYVIKADGLMGGKGVKVAGEQLSDRQQAIDYVKALLAQQQSVLIEEKFVGEEFSLHTFTDGHSCQHLPVVQDHKRAFPGDTGPNTGGMGSYSCANHRLPFLNEFAVRQAQEINQATIAALRQHTGIAYRGILYGGYMLTADGVKLIEFNARFGDPEAMNLLPLLENDFLEICQSIVSGQLQQQPIHFKRQASVCKYLVPTGYPEQPVRGEMIQLAPPTAAAKLFFASVCEQSPGQLQLLGSRALAYLSLAEHTTLAEQQVEQAIQQVSGPVFHRPDIGTEALLARKQQRMQTLTNQVIRS